MSENSVSLIGKVQARIEDLREKIFQSIGNYLEKGYKFIRIKPNRTSEQQKFLRSYENMFLLQSTGLFFMCVSGIYFSKFTLKNKTLEQKELKKLLVKAGLVSTLGGALTLNAFMINSRQKVLQKAEGYGKRFEDLAQALKPENWEE